ncbi:hypothetical protein EG328_001751 [Venturia inaequalis]|uniref:Uncharacterized protein n=1 Tax=Venturia inaequalis TaxID=5025 RepID=A0A8H3UZA1_VENIN|nr:hypothetical protein EG328_001751 [Venturia inaequalis]RDI83358.1 hypothetical protein Vi05172_g6723 [Venturia inaequalis]
MKLTTTFIAAILATMVQADKHRYCGCNVDGKYDVDLSHKTCTKWGQTMPNTEWSGSHKPAAVSLFPSFLLFDVLDRIDVVADMKTVS